MIKVENLSKSFGGLRVLSGVDLEIQKGECVAIIGPSGAGKSVLLYCLNALEKPDSGRVTLNGVDITDKRTDINKVREKVGMVYQNFHLFSHLTVLENIILAPVKVRKLPRAEAISRACGLLETVSLLDKKDSYPDQLSGGQKQRIAIVRALAMDPEILLFDEPTSALDPSMVGEVLAVIRALAKQGFTMVIVTHEMNFAREVADRVLFMEEQGVYESGSPEKILVNPEREKTIAFIRKLKTFNYKVDSYNFDLIGMCARLELFCAKYAIEKKQVNGANLALEEVITYILKYCYEKPRQPDINVTVEYGDADKKIAVEIAHDGKSVDPFGKVSASAGGAVDPDYLGIFMVKKMSAEIVFSHADGLSRFKIKI